MTTSSIRTLFAACCAAFALAALTVSASAEAQSVPVIERIEPTSGPPGTAVTLVGRAMDAQTQIFLGSAACAITERTPNRWVFTIPAGAVTGSISVRNAVGVSTTNPLFRVTAPPAAPVIERVEPASAAPGAEVVIRGQNFSPRATDNVVLLGDRPLVVRSATPFDLRVVIPDGAVTGPLRVRVGTAGEVVSAQPFTVATGIAITDFQPRLGPPATRVVITGTGFSPTKSQNRVFLNNLPVRVERATATQLDVVIPANAASGPLLVDVRNGGRTQTAVPFVVAFPPTIEGFEPAAAPPGRSVTLRGTNFGTDVRAVDARFAVTLTGAAGGATGNAANTPVATVSQPAVVRAVTPTTLTVEVPAGDAGRGRFVVNVAGLGPAQSATDFTRLAPVAVADFQPRSGPAGATVRITGAGYSTTLADNTVTLQGARCEVTAATATELTVRIPAGAQSGLFEVTVANNGTTRAVTAFVVTRPPTIAGFTPARLTVTQDVTITGTGFGTTSSLVEVSLNGRPLQLLTLSDTQITAKVPVGVATGRLSVLVRLQGGALSATDLVVDPLLAVASFAPQTGFPGTRVALRGEGFLAGSTVLFNGTSATPLSVSPTAIDVVVPAGATTGAISVRTPDGRVIAAAGAFTVTAVPSGVAITGVEPACMRPGCTVVLRGYGFSARANQNRVFFGTFPARVMSASTTALTVALPRQPGTQSFKVDVRGAGIAQSEPLTIAP
jgi:hypothetical protein